MRILVTGGAGFIASHIVDRYLAMGHEVAVLDDLSTGHRENLNPKAQFHEADIQSEAAAHAIAAFRPEVVNHHAAQMSVPASVDDPVRDAKINLVGFLNVMEAARKAGTRKVVFASSGGTVYGEPETLPAHEDTPPLPNNPYGIAKHTTEHYLSWYASQHGISYTALRYSNVYGPRQLPHGEAGVVAIFFLAMLAGKAPAIFGDGKYVRDYVFVSDVVEANASALGRGDREAVNIGTGVPTDTNMLYVACAKVAGFPGAANHGEPRRGDLRANYLDPTRAVSVLGWRPSVSLEDGLSKTLAFFRARPQSAR